MTRYEEAVLILFKAIPESEKKTMNTGKHKQKVKELLSHGIYIDEKVQQESLPKDLTDAMIKHYGYDLNKVHQTLHKSFETVKNATPFELFLDQILHYISVYSQNPTGKDTDTTPVDPSLVYIPTEELNLDTTAAPVKITVITTIPEKDIVQRTKDLLSSAIAMDDITKNSVMEIIAENKEHFDSLDNIKNKEIRIFMMEELNIPPATPSELLRFMVYKRTRLTLYVQSKRTLNFIRTEQEKENNKTKNSSIEELLTNFVDKYGIESIAREFNRHRDFWVIFKHEGPKAAKIINKARKLSTTLNQKARLKALDRVGDSSVTLEDIEKELKNVSIFKKVSVLNSILKRKENQTSNLYVIRTGKSFAKKKDKIQQDTERLDKIYSLILNSLVEDIRPLVENKKINLPQNIEYAFPTSMKKFIGNIPFYSSIKMIGNAVVGIHWKNVKTKTREERVDLDLHYTSKKYHIGWNTGFSSLDRKRVFHTGDITDAPLPKGASEAVCIPKDMDDDFAELVVNRYTPNSVPIPFSMYIGETEDITHDHLLSCKDFRVNINDMEIKDKGITLGFVETCGDERTLYFMNTALGDSIISSCDRITETALEAVSASAKSCLKLKDILDLSGAVFEKGEDENWDIDLSLESLTRDSFSFLTAPVSEEKDGVVEK